MTNKHNDFFRPYPLWFKETISNKEELKEGDIVTLRNGDRLIYTPDNDSNDFYDLSDNHNYLCDLSDLKDDLTYDGSDRDNDIVKVERPVQTEVIFERKDKAREMTVEEISKELGYEVKIIKNK